MRTTTALLLVAGVLATTSGVSARALKPEAQGRLDAGLAAYKAQNWEDAIRELEGAYSLDPDPDLLYTLAQAERQGGRCASALGHYRKYLASKPASALSPNRAN